MKGLFLVLCILLALLQHRLWIGENTLPEYFGLKQQISQQQLSNEKLMARNQTLMEEISDLRSGNEALEERARNELGMIKQDETFFRVVKEKSHRPTEFSR